MDATIRFYALAKMLLLLISLFPTTSKLGWCISCNIKHVIYRFQNAPCIQDIAAPFAPKLILIKWFLTPISAPVITYPFAFIWLLRGSYKWFTFLYAYIKMVPSEPEITVFLHLLQLRSWINRSSVVAKTLRELLHKSSLVSLDIII